MSHSVCACVCILASAYVKPLQGSEDEGGGGVCVCALSFIKPPTHLYMDGVWGQA